MHNSKHCGKGVQIWSFFWSVFSCIRTAYGDFRSKSPYSDPNVGKYGPEKTPYLNTFHAVKSEVSSANSLVAEVKHPRIPLIYTKNSNGTRMKS